MITTENKSLPEFTTPEQCESFIKVLLERINQEVFGGACNIFIGNALIELRNTLSNGDTQGIYFLYEEPDGVATPLILEPWFEITIKEIKDRYIPVSDRDPEHNDNILILGNQMGYLKDHYDRGINSVHHPMTVLTYTAQSFDDVDRIAQEMIPFVRTYVARYFNENMSIARVDYLLNSDPIGAPLHTLLGTDQAYMGLIAAKLVGNPQYESLKELYIKRMEHVTGNVKADFMKAVEYIDTQISV